MLLTNGDLDVCHGHTGKLTISGKKQQTLYHYHATAEYPYTLGCFTGTADASTASTMGGGGGKAQQGGGSGKAPPGGGQGGQGPPPLGGGPPPPS